MKSQFKVSFQYFKDTGKYYSRGSEIMPLTDCGSSSGHTVAYMTEVVDWVKDRQARDESLPGLTSSWKDGYVLVICEEGAFPYLILPKAMRQERGWE